MRADGRTTTLADVRIGESAVLVAGQALEARRARHLVELGLRPGVTVCVMMRTAGGGRILGVDNLRIAVDRHILGKIPVTLTRPVVSPGPITGGTAKPLAGRATRPSAVPGPVPARHPPGPPLAESLFVNPRASEQVPGRVPGKAAGGPDSGAIGADENAAGRRPGAAQPRNGGLRTGSERIPVLPVALTAAQSEPLMDRTD
jgi:Fe2+ transport system protein FeoA